MTTTVDQLLAHVHRGPCGGWHYADGRDRHRFCRACTTLATRTPEAA